MNSTQIMLQTINDIDDFVVRLSNNINEETLSKLENFKSQINVILQNNAEDTNNIEDICRQAVEFMQSVELDILSNQKKQDEDKLLQDLFSQTVNVSSNSTIVNDKIVKNKNNRFKNMYYRYFYKWQVAENDFDDDRLLYDLVDNIYILWIYSFIVLILLTNIDNFLKHDILLHYQIFAVGWFGLCLRFCKVTTTKNNLSIVLDIFIIWCFFIWFWFVKLFFALS